MSTKKTIEELNQVIFDLESEKKELSEKYEILKNQDMVTKEEYDKLKEEYLKLKEKYEALQKELKLANDFIEMRILSKDKEEANKKREKQLKRSKNRSIVRQNFKA
jgi:predicted nuclease with TOPRIM domain